MRKSLLFVPLIGLLAACATAPKPLQGTFSPITPTEAVRSAASGQTVRWGGEIIKVEPKTDATCFEILGRDLDASARPLRRDTSQGRFIACRGGFYDPEVFMRGRSLTVVGHLDGSETGRVGQFDYTYPRVAADAIYLWPRESQRVRVDPWPYYDPFWGPRWGPYWGLGYWGWSAPRHIVVPRR